MKISEMTNNQACDALAKITECVGNITDDTAMKPLIKELTQETTTMNMLEVLQKLVPLITVSHRMDVYGIFSAILQKPATVIGDMSLGETFKEIKASLDPELIRFFDLLLTRTKNTANS